VIHRSGGWEPGGNWVVEQLSYLKVIAMTAGTLRLSERSKRLYAKRCAHQPRLLDVPISCGSSVRAFVRPRRKLPAPAQDINSAASPPGRPQE
jgi:hypothetical protein